MNYIRMIKIANKIKEAARGKRKPKSKEPEVSLPKSPSSEMSFESTEDREQDKLEAQEANKRRLEELSKMWKGAPPPGPKDKILTDEELEQLQNENLKSITQTRRERREQEEKQEMEELLKLLEEQNKILQGQSEVDQSVERAKSDVKPGEALEVKEIGGRRFIGDPARSAPPTEYKPGENFKLPSTDPIVIVQKVTNAEGILKDNLILFKLTFSSGPEERILEQFNKWNVKIDQYAKTKCLELLKLKFAKTCTAIFIDDNGEGKSVKAIR